MSIEPKTEKIFLKHNLTIVDIAEATQIHPKRISYALNNQLKLNLKEDKF